MIIFVQEGIQASTQLNVFKKAARYFTESRSLNPELVQEPIITREGSEGISDWLLGKIGGSKKKEPPIIDMFQANQIAKSSQLGFSTFLPAMRCKAELIDQSLNIEMKSRKRLFKERYFKILEKQQAQVRSAKLTKKSPNIQGASYGKGKIYTGFSNIPNLSNNESLVQVRTKKKQFAYFPKKQSKSNCLVNQKVHQFDEQQNRLRKMAIEKINNFGEKTPTLTPTQIPTKPDASQKLEKLQKLQLSKQSNQTNPKSEIKKQQNNLENKQQKPAAFNPFLSKGYKKLDLNSIISGNYKIKEVGEFQEKPTISYETTGYHQPINQYQPVNEAYPPISHLNNALSPNIPNHSPFSLVNFSGGIEFGYSSNNETSSGNFAAPQYPMPMGLSNHTEQEKKTALAMFFCSSAQNPQSLFTETERTSKKSRPHRQKNRETTRIS